MGEEVHRDIWLQCNPLHGAMSWHTSRNCIASASLRSELSSRFNTCGAETARSGCSADGRHVQGTGTGVESVAKGGPSAARPCGSDSSLSPADAGMSAAAGQCVESRCSQVLGKL